MNELHAWCVLSYEYRIDNVLLAYENELAYDGRLLTKTSFKSNTEDFTISKFDA